ncbi:Lsr2 family protein [Actinoplanes sp. NPDC049668]|uniref:histone-like nucleoid-structuring protein Lsr2 n=1 Tax=unclassified Actinoplanes TaxID=2626549 RepID=UPI0033AD5DCA
MAKVTRIVDDLDGTELKDGDGGGTVTFSIRGQYYEIDLSKKNQDALDKALEKYTNKATKVAAPVRGGGVAKKVTKVSPAGDKDQRLAIREWANANGHKVSDRGRISQDILDAYEAAH